MCVADVPEAFRVKTESLLMVHFGCMLVKIHGRRQHIQGSSLSNTHHTVDCVRSLVLWFMNHAGLNESNPLGKRLDGPQDVNCSQRLDPVRQANHV